MLFRELFQDLGKGAGAILQPDGEDFRDPVLGSQ